VTSNEAQHAGSRLLWRSAWRYAWQHRWQTGLNILGILIGVMMVVAVDLANTSARRAFDRSLDILNGSITHQIVGGSEGVPEQVFTEIKRVFGVRRAAPALSGQVRVGNRQLTLVGVDVISEASLDRNRPGMPDNAFALAGDFVSAIGTPDRVFMAQSLAAALGLEAGASFAIRTQTGSQPTTLAGVFNSADAEATSALLLADMAAAQVLLNRAGRLDSIDLVLDDQTAQQLESWLPDGLLLVPAQVRSENLREMSEAFHINLLAMSLLSLLVAGLLIYNTVTLSVIQRQQTLGIFRSQGVTARQLLILVLGENALIGLAASVLGVLAGWWLGGFLVTMVTGTVDALYYDLAVSGYSVSPLVLGKGLLLGMVLSLASALLPAIRAARSKPVTLQHGAAEGREWHRLVPWLAGGGLLLMLAGFLVLQPDYGSLASGFVALTVIVFGFCLLVPLLLTVLLSLMLACGRRWLGLAAVMALRSSLAAINRTGLAVAALCVAISVTVGVGVMVTSFRGTVIVWLEESLPGDLQVTAINGEFPPAMQASLQDIPGIAGVSPSVLRESEAPFGPVRLGMNTLPAATKFYMKDVAPGGFEAFDAGRGVFVSEPLAYLQQLALGDDITLLTGRGMQTFTVLGIFHDYTSGIGLVHLPAPLYAQYWPNEPMTRLTLSVSTDAGAEAVATALRAQLDVSGVPYTLVSNSELRELTLQIFDRTFAITHVLRMLAILVAFVGVLSTLMALQLERLREYAILRATGMTPGQVISLVLRQTTVLGMCAGLLALPLGLLMADILIEVINRRSFGWSMQHLLPPDVLTEGFVLAVIAALIAGAYPAWRAGHIRPALALRRE